MRQVEEGEIKGQRVSKKTSQWRAAESSVLAHEK